MVLVRVENQLCECKGWGKWSAIPFYTPRVPALRFSELRIKLERTSSKSSLNPGRNQGKMLDISRKISKFQLKGTCFN